MLSLASATLISVLGSYQPDSMSLEETVQPSYHVTAMSHQPSISIDKLEGADGGHTESRTSEQVWMYESADSNAVHGGPNDLGMARHSRDHEAVDRSVDRNRTSQNGRSLPLRLTSPLIGGTSSRPATSKHGSPGLLREGKVPTQNGMDEGLPSPPDSGPKSPAKAAPPNVVTPKKRIPEHHISYYSPQKYSSHKNTSVLNHPFGRLSPNPLSRPSKPAKTTTPRKTRRRTGQTSSPDSFGEQAEQRKVPPLERLDEIFGGARRRKRTKTRNLEDSEGDSDARDDQPQNRDEIIDAEDHLRQVRNRRQDSHVVADEPAKPVDTTVQATSQVLNPTFGRATPAETDVVSQIVESASARFPSSPVQLRFPGLPESGTTSSPGHSNLFSSQADGFGTTQGSLPPLDFAATQVVTAARSLKSPSIPRNTVYDGQQPSAVTVGSGPSIPPHRRLGRTVPNRQEADIDRHVPNSVRARPSPQFTISPGHATTTQAKQQDVRGHAGGFTSPIADDPCLQATYIDVPEVNDPLPNAQDKNNAPTVNERPAKRKRNSKARSPTGSVTESSSASEDPQDSTYRPQSKNTDKINVRTTGPRISAVKEPEARSARPSSSTAGPLRTNARQMQPIATIIDPTAILPSTSQSSGLLVLGWWARTKSFFPGYASGSPRTKIRVDFLDQTHASMTIDRLRHCELRKGDLIRSVQPINGEVYNEVEVEEDWPGGDATIRVCYHGEAVGCVQIKDLYIRQSIINAHFDDRRVVPEALATGAVVSASGDPAPAFKDTYTSSVLTGKIFLITSAGRRQTGQDELCALIKASGGAVVTEWNTLFDLSSNGFNSAFLTEKVPLVLVHGEKTVMKPKMMAALAKGIPCIASEYIQAAIERVSHTWQVGADGQNAHWREYLVSAGQTDLMAQASSQWVDPEWGGEGWDPKSAQRRIRPFTGKRVLFLVPQSSDAKYRDVTVSPPYTKPR